jgi:glycerate kinase
MRTTTFGTGELIRAALERGCRKLILGIGGSATVDGGAGMAQALGARLIDPEGKEIPRGGGGLARLDRIDVSSLDARIRDADTIVACDVDNPLVGPRGAPAVFGPQKGATPETVRMLDRFLERYALIIQRDLGVDVKDLPGAGAAGGLGAGCVAFLGARLAPGIDIVIELSQLDSILEGADLVITGEGKIDGQTVYGKTPAGVARRAKAHGVPIVAIAGNVADDSRGVYAAGIDALMPATSFPMTLEEAMERAPALLADAAERAMRLITIFRSPHPGPPPPGGWG